MSDNKSEAAGAPEFQPESSRAASADGESKSEIAAAKQSSPAPVKESPAASASSIQPNGAQVGKEKAAGRDEPDQSLGAFLIAAREGRGLTADDVARETRLPRHYLRMMETNDYSEISDQLYLVPFLRSYASFLDLDQEDVAMRFVREVQRADGNPGPARLDQPLVAEPAGIADGPGRLSSLDYSSRPRVFTFTNRIGIARSVPIPSCRIPALASSGPVPTPVTR